MIYDCIVVGGGAAGLSAALMLGRCRRRVLVCDTGEPRNRWSRAMHGYLTRDGTSPQEFLDIAREELRQYPSVECRAARVVDARQAHGGFQVTCADGTGLRSRKLLLATGVRDDLPPIPGLPQLYGVSVHHCPYCDAWEWRDQPIAAYGRGESGTGLALGLTLWTSDLVLCTDGRAQLDGSVRHRLARHNIEVCEERIACLEGQDGKLQRIVFQDGSAIKRLALFFATGQSQHSDLTRRLGCRFTEHGTVDTGKCESTNVAGLYVAGDASKEAQFVIVAAAEGAEAAKAINQALLKEDLEAAEAEVLL
ncbi:MAG TPA: NAD(P)/FAD-dependent oxidoreductase [Gemmatimonadales bacterium]